MNPKGEKLRTCGLEGIKGSLAEPLEVDLELDTWLKVLKSYFLGVQILVAALRFTLDTQ